MTARDLVLWKQFWEEGANVFTDAQNRTMCAWAQFPTGTPVIDVWTWFDQQFSLGVLATIEAMTPKVSVSFSFARKEFVVSQQMPDMQISLFDQRSSDDWGETKAEKGKGMDRLF